MIIEGDLPPGTRINEGQIGNHLGVSRTPLREAIKFLASEGLIELVPSRGAVVKKFSPKEVRDMMTVLQQMEQYAAVRACAIASPEAIGQVRALHDQMIGRYRKGDRMSYYKLNQQIHTSIVALADNAALSDVHAILQTRLKRVRFISHEGAEKWARAVAEHEAIIAALEARDAGRLSAVMGQHLDQAWASVKDVISA